VSADAKLRLTPADLAAFARFGISPELLMQAGVRRVTDDEARNIFGIVGSPTKNMAGIIFPYVSIKTGQRITARVRRDNPEIENGKEKNKYISAYGDRKHLFFPPNAADKLKSPETAIALVEAEKSCLALSAWAERTGTDLVAVAMGGCWGWHGRIGKVENARGERVDEMGPISDLSRCDGRRVYVLLDANVASNPKVRQAQNALVAELQKRNCEALLCNLPETDSVNGPDDYIAACGDEAMRQVFAHAAEADRPVEFSDDALALKFAELHADNLRYTAVWGRWSRWDDTCWQRDETLCIFDMVRAVCREAASECGGLRLALRVASAGTVAAVERLARSDRRHAATVDQWDADPWLLNTPAGVIDLQTGRLRSAKRGDYLTKTTAVGPSSDCPAWHTFLKRITDGNDELQCFLQRMCGYALTGSTREHAMFFLYGSGSNGKTVFLNTVSGILSDYATSAAIETFIASANEHHPTDLAGLHGARVVTAIETEDGQRWAESKLKALTGGDRIAARFMRQDFFSFVPQFKLLIAGNHKPSIRTVDEAMRRRFYLLPFSVTIPLTERDAELAEKLRAEWGGILKWMVDGCLAWQRNGLNPPAAVRDATDKYLSDEDSLARWIDDRCITGPQFWYAGRSLFDSWSDWCKQTSERPGTQKRFCQQLEARGFGQERTAKVRGFVGIALRTDAGVTDVTG
jgi:putative DNA primase/helicase